MTPLFFGFLIFEYGAGIVGVCCIIALCIFQLVLIFKRPNRTPIHDVLCDTVVCDFDCQQIFENENELIKYKEEYARKQSEKDLI